MPHYPSRGRPLHYETVGEGRPVLLLHGFTNHAFAWAAQLGPLVHAGHRAILPDLDGHGRSPPADRVTTVAALAEDAVALLDHLWIERAVVCGLSLGGMVAQQLAVAAPERVAGLVVANSRPEADTPELREAVSGWIALLEQPDGPRKRLAATWPILVNAAFRESPTGAAAYEAWAAVLARIPGASLGNVARGMTAFNVVERLAGVRAPTLVVSGEEDRLIPPAASRAIAERIAGAAFHVIPGAGHISNLDSPAAFNGLMLDFLERA
jgi:3-oxoadipate enol-lactonase